MDLTEKLKDLRKEKNWTQAEAARKIDIQQSYLSKLETSRHMPSPEVIDKLCAAYDIDKKDLLLAKPLEANIVHNLILAIMSLVSFVLMSSGLFATIFPDTFFTYRLEGQVQQGHLLPRSHFIDNYQGETYVVTIENTEYEYQLVAERKVSRVENLRLVSAGLILLLLSVGSLWLKGAFRFNNAEKAKSD